MLAHPPAAHWARSGVCTLSIQGLIAELPVPGAVLAPTAAARYIEAKTEVCRDRELPVGKVVRWPRGELEPRRRPWPASAAEVRAAGRVTGELVEQGLSSCICCGGGYSVLGQGVRLISQLCGARVESVTKDRRA